MSGGYCFIIYFILYCYMFRSKLISLLYLCFFLICFPSHTQDWPTHPLSALDGTISHYQASSDRGLCFHFLLSSINVHNNTKGGFKTGAAFAWASPCPPGLCMCGHMYVCVLWCEETVKQSSQHPGVRRVESPPTNRDLQTEQPVCS